MIMLRTLKLNLLREITQTLIDYFYEVIYCMVRGEEKMEMSICKADLFSYIKNQMSHFFPDNNRVEGNDIKIAFDYALERVENCFISINNSMYSDENGNTFFSHLHSDQYAQFIYFFSNSLWKMSGNKPICDKLLALNRVLNNIFISYKCELPEHFMLGHAFGTIIGNADFEDYLFVSQNVTINTGEEKNGVRRPHIGKGVWLGPGTQIIGNESIGNRVSVGVNTVIYNKRIPDDSIVINRGRGTEILRNARECCKAQLFFRTPL